VLRLQAVDIPFQLGLGQLRQVFSRLGQVLGHDRLGLLLPVGAVVAETDVALLAHFRFPGGGLHAVPLAGVGPGVLPVVVDRQLPGVEQVDPPAVLDPHAAVVAVGGGQARVAVGGQVDDVLLQAHAPEKVIDQAGMVTAGPAGGVAVMGQALQPVPETGVDGRLVLGQGVAVLSEAVAGLDQRAAAPDLRRGVLHDLRPEVLHDLRVRLGRQPGPGQQQQGPHETCP